MNKLENKVVKYVSAGQEIKISPNVVRDYLVSGQKNYVSNEEIAMFINLCKYQKLNPFLREAYLIKFSEKKPAQLVVSKDAYIRKANENPMFDGIKSGLILQRQDQQVFSTGSFHLKTDVIVGAWATVYLKGRSIPHEVTISCAEYQRDTDIWKAKPGTMLRKTAVIQALREAFPLTCGIEIADEGDVEQEDNREYIQNPQEMKTLSMDEDAFEAEIIPDDDFEEPEF